MYVRGRTWRGRRILNEGERVKDERIQALDPATKLSVVLCDCTAAAGALARAHLSGPTASHYLAQALAGVTLLGAETSQDEETVTFRLDCPGPLGGFLVEATAAGTLRGYTKQKILNDFDGFGAPKDAHVLGESGTFEIIRSVPGTILASGAVAINDKIGVANDKIGVADLRVRIHNFIAQGLDSGLSARTLNLRLSALSTWCNWLLRQGLLDSNPVAKVPRPKQAKKLPQFYTEKALDNYFDESRRVGNCLRAHASEKARTSACGGTQHNSAFVRVSMQRGTGGGDARRNSRGGARRASAAT